jgi:hypothetical protein
MKDFINAAQAGQKMAGAADDAAYQKVKKSYLQAQLDTIAAKNADEAGEGGERRAEGERLTNQNLALTGRLLKSRAGAYDRAGTAQPVAPTDEDAAAATAVPGAPPIAPAPIAPAPIAPAPAATGAVPAAPAPQVVGQNDPAEDAAGIPQQQAATGGPIKHFAAGGAVDGDDDEEDADGPVQVAAVGGAAPTQAAPTGPGFSGAAANDAIDAAHAYEEKHFGLDKMAAVGSSPGRQAQARARATGAHAAPLADMTKLKQAVDPHNQMGESTRNLAAIGALYQFKMNKGDTEGAARAAYQMIQHYRVAVDKYAAIAAVAGQKGDTDTMVHAAMKAYANIPDGKNFNITKTPEGQLQYSFTDDHGKVISQGIEPPQKLAAAAMGMVQGNGFDDALAQRAGLPPPKPVAGPKPMKVSDKTALLKGVNASYATQNPDVPDPNDSSKTVPKYSPDDQTLHKGAAFRMYNHPNNNMTPDEAAQVATRIADPTIPDKGGFSPKPVDGGVEVTFGKRKTFVPQDDFDALLAKRADALDAKKKAGADDDSKGSWLQGHSIVDGVKGAVGSAVDWTKKDLEKAAKEYPEATARLKSAVGAVGNAASDAKDYIEKEAAKPNIFKGIANGPGEDKI